VGSKLKNRTNPQTHEAGSFYKKDLNQKPIIHLVKLLKTKFFCNLNF